MTHDGVAHELDTCAAIRPVSATTPPVQRPPPSSTTATARGRLGPAVTTSRTCRRSPSVATTVSPRLGSQEAGTRARRGDVRLSATLASSTGWGPPPIGQKGATAGHSGWHFVRVFNIREDPTWIAAATDKEAIEMGARGPVPKRSTQRRRRNKDSKPESVQAAPAKVKRPAVAGHWHPIAKAWYRSLGESGQAQFFEPSDWEAARFVAETMTLNLKAKRFSAQLFAAVWSAMTDLLTTEGARRRARIEIEREVDKVVVDDGESEVAQLDAYRRRVAG